MDDKSLKIIAKLVDYLKRVKGGVKGFNSIIHNKVFKQQVRSRRVQEEYDLIKSDNFFSILHELGIRKKNNEHRNLMKIVALDSGKYVELLMVKKL